MLDPWPLPTLQQRLLVVLQRLNDLDTRSASYHTLLSFMHNLEPESVPILVECLCQNHTHQKPAARALIVDLIGRLSASARSSLIPYASRLIQFVMKSIQDADLHVQEAGGISLAQICRYSLPDKQFQSVLTSIYRLMSNKPAPIQASAARALARLLSDLEPALLTDSYAAISVVIQKHLSRPNLHPIIQRYLFDGLAAIPALRPSPSALPSLFRSLTSSLSSSGSWQSSHSAARALQSWAHEHYYQIYGRDVLAALQQARFHRIAQVREAATAALNKWISLPTSPVVVAVDPPPTTNEDDRGEHDVIQPTPFEYATELAPSPPRRKPTNNVQNKIVRQQRVLFDLVEDLCRRVDTGLEQITTRLTSLEAVTEQLQRQQRDGGGDRAAGERPAGVWNRIADLMERGDLNGALRTSCEIADDICLVRLLGRCSRDVEIQPEIWTMLMVRFTILLGRGLFTDNITPWICKAVEDQVPIPTSIHDAVKQALSLPNVSPSLTTLSRRLNVTTTTT